MWTPISANQAGSYKINITHLHWTPVGPVFPAISHGIQPSLMGHGFGEGGFLQIKQTLGCRQLEAFYCPPSLQPDSTSLSLKEELTHTPPCFPKQWWPRNQHITRKGSGVGRGMVPPKYIHSFARPQKFPESLIWA